MRIAPGSVEALAQNPAIPKAPGLANPKSDNRRFVLTIDGLDCTDVASISSITVRIPPGGAPQISNFTIKMTERAATLAAWKTWFETLTANADSSDTYEKEGTLEISDRHTVLLTLGFKGLGIVRMSRLEMRDRDLGPSDGTREVELYCEGMTIKVEAPKPPPPGPVVKDTKQRDPATEKHPPLPPKPPTTEAPPATAPEDKGARDPEGAPRMPDTLRTNFTANLTKFSSEEVGEYATKASMQKVEAFFTEAMKEKGWELSGRSESGKEAGYTIELRWDFEKNQHAQVHIGKAKDGTTAIVVRMQKTLK